MAWRDSKRRDELPRDWPRIRRRILKRDPTCRCTGCPRCSVRGCASTSTEVDHLRRGNNHDDDNLAGKCRACHAHKSGREGQAARSASRARRTRAVEPHPGRVGGTPRP